jgi:hypothetical protein
MPGRRSEFDPDLHLMTEWRMREKMRDDERIIVIVWCANRADAINLQRMPGYLRTSPHDRHVGREHDGETLRFFGRQLRASIAT